MNPTLFAAIVVALFGPVATYVVAVRKLSGKVGTSEASQLWEESRSIRNDYRAQIEHLNDTVKQCEGRISTLEHRNDDLLRENGRLTQKVEELKRIILSLETTILELRAQIAAATA